MGQWLSDFEKKLKEVEGEDTLKMTLVHMGGGLQEFQDGSFSSSKPSIMLSMGEDFMDKEERSHGVR